LFGSLLLGHSCLFPPCLPYPLTFFPFRWTDLMFLSSPLCSYFPHVSGGCVAFSFSLFPFFWLGFAWVSVDGFVLPKRDVLPPPPLLPWRFYYQSLSDSGRPWSPRSYPLGILSSLCIAFTILLFLLPVLIFRPLAFLRSFLGFIQSFYRPSPYSAVPAGVGHN